MSAEADAIRELQEMDARDRDRISEVAELLEDAEDAPSADDIPPDLLQLSLELDDGTAGGTAEAARALKEMRNGNAD